MVILKKLARLKTPFRASAQRLYGSDAPGTSLTGGGTRGLKLGTNKKTRKGVWLQAANGELSLEPRHSVARVIYRWMFSWSQPMYCTTKQEYEISKAIFLIYIQSEAAIGAIGSAHSESILQFVRHHVFPHETSFAYYTHHDVFHMEVHTNTAHGGTNNGIKHCSVPIRPQNTIDRAARKLNLGAETQPWC